VQHRGPPGAEAGRAAGLDADEPHVEIVDEPREEPDRVRAAPDAGQRDLGQPPLGLEDLRAGLAADHGLQLTDDLRVRRRPDARADQIVRVLDVGDPVADRLARGLLQRPRPELDRAHLRAEQGHPLEVRPLPTHVLGAHVDDAVEPEPRADRRRGDAVLARAGLGDDSLLAEPHREQRLAERVVELVGAGVQQVLPLEVEPLPWREALRERERCRSPGIGAAELLQLLVIARIVARLAPARLKLVQCRDQRLGHEAAAVLTVGQLHLAASTYARTRA
jgi:hypothetical protein